MDVAISTHSSNGFVGGLKPDVWSDLQWDALLRPHPILRSTFCPVPAFKGSSDYIFALCVLDTLPGNTKRPTRRMLPHLCSEEQELAAESRMSVTQPAAPIYQYIYSVVGIGVP